MGEFLQFIGIWLVITYASPGDLSRKEFWSLKKNTKERGAPFRLNDLMSSNRFEDIIRNLTYTNLQPPAFKDKFWEIQQMVEEWNKSMREVFIPGWINCLDESMLIWSNKWTCPGYVFVDANHIPLAMNIILFVVGWTENLRKKVQRWG